MADRYDLVIVGMGAAGCAAAEYAAGLGVRVAAVEHERVGGANLWRGSVPSKALVAAARAAHTMRTADRFGLPAVRPEVDTSLVWARVRAVQDGVARGDADPQRYEDMGVDLLRGDATLIGPNRVRVVRRHPPAAEPGPDDADADAELELEARFVLVATGSQPTLPDVDGLAAAGPLTVDALFALDRAPASVVVLGAGSWGVEVSQALSRLGTRTTLLEQEVRILPGEEPDLVDVLTRRLGSEGVDVAVDVVVDRVTRAHGRVVLSGTQAGAARSWSAAALVVAAGRSARVAGLGLEDVGVVVGPGGVEVDERLRTAVPSIYAAGDATGRHRVRQAAVYEGVRAVRDMFFPGRGRANEAVPTCTFTDPELARAGLTTAEAEERYGDDVHVWRQDLAHSDRALADAEPDGSVVVVTARNKVVGAHVLAPHAGDVIHELALAMREGLSLSALGGMVHAYPTYATAIEDLGAEAAQDRAESFRWLVRKGRGEHRTSSRPGRRRGEVDPEA